MTKEQTIKDLEEENLRIITENKKLRNLIHNIKISLEQGDTNISI